MRISNSRVLFEEPPRGVIQVIQQTFQIFITHWKPLAVLSFYQYLSFVVAFAILLLLTFIMAASYVTAAASVMQQNGGFTYGGADVQDDAAAAIYGYGNGGSRSLSLAVVVDSANKIVLWAMGMGMGMHGGGGGVVGDHGAFSRARLLVQNYYGDYYNDADTTTTNGIPYYDPLANLGAGVIVAWIFIVFIWIVALSIVGSIFAGSFTHAVAEVYAGGGSLISAKRSLQKGIERMWAVYCYQIVFSCIIMIALVLMVVLPWMMELENMMTNEKNAADPPFPSASNILVMVLCVVMFGIFVAVLTAFTSATIPSIVVERNSPMQGVRRSFHLCKQFVCFIFCSNICFQLVFFVGMSLVNYILNRLPAILGIMGHFIVQIAASSIFPVLSFVLYMSMRIRTENVTQDTVAEEIGYEFPVATGSSVELQQGSFVSSSSSSSSPTSKKSSNGNKYEIITNAEVV